MKTFNQKEYFKIKIDYLQELAAEGKYEVAASIAEELKTQFLYENYMGGQKQ